MYTCILNSIKTCDFCTLLRQDYETPGMDYYLFEVRIPGETVAVLVALMIVNIDDNAPIIQMLAPCEIAVSGWTLIHLWLRAKP